MTDPEKATSPSETPEPESPAVPESETPAIIAAEPEPEVPAPDPGVTTTYRARRAALTAPADDEAAAPAEPVAAVASDEPERKKTPRAKRAVPPVEPSSQYAVIATGGKQYRVKVGDRLQVERLHAEAGSDITIEKVLLVGGDGSTRIGTPVVDGASVTAHIDEHARGEKIVVFKFKAKKRYRRRTGHRQELTRLTITGISG